MKTIESSTNFQLIFVPSFCIFNAYFTVVENMICDVNFAGRSIYSMSVVVRETFYSLLIIMSPHPMGRETYCFWCGSRRRPHCSLSALYLLNQ